MTGSVTDNGSLNVGGLVGGNGGRISQAYATGNVSGVAGVGGLAGSNTPYGSIGQVYATGAVSGRYGAGSLGKFAGINQGALAAGYWIPTNTYGERDVGDGSSTGASGLTTAQMTDLANFRTNFAGFDFATVWAPPNQAGQGGQTVAYYPQLYALSRVLTVTANTSRVYGDSNPSLIANYNGLRAGDFVTTLGSLTTSATATSNVGNYAATASGSAVTAAGGASYRILNVPSTLTVTQRPVTITAISQSRSYGEDNAVLTYSNTSLGAGVGLSGTLTTVATATSDVGSYDITRGSLTDTANPNYNITYAGAVLVITQRPITITADARSRTYGDANPALTYTVGGSGLVNGDTLTGTLTTNATITSGLGNYPISQGTLAATSNYRINYRSALLTVTPSVAIVDSGMIASRVVNDNIDWIALPDDATPLSGLPPIATTFGDGIFYSDPRFDRVLVCFGGGGGAAASCFAAR